MQILCSDPYCLYVTFPPTSFSKIVPLETGMTTGTTGLHQLQRPHWSSLALIHLTPNPALLGIQGRRSKCCPEPSRGHGAKATDRPVRHDVCPSPSPSARSRPQSRCRPQRPQRACTPHCRGAPASLRTDNVSSH